MTTFRQEAIEELKRFGISGPLIYLMDEEKYTLSIALAMFQGQYGSDWGQMMAMASLMTVPIVVLFFFTQKQFIQGVKLSGIKG